MFSFFYVWKQISLWGQGLGLGGRRGEEGKGPTDGQRSPSLVFSLVFSNFSRCRVRHHEYQAETSPCEYFSLSTGSSHSLLLSSGSHSTFLYRLHSEILWGPSLHVSWPQVRSWPQLWQPNIQIQTLQLLYQRSNDFIKHIRHFYYR